MKSVEYSQLVKRKLLKLKKELIGEYGEEKTKEILTAMADHVDMLGQHEESGVRISRMYDIDTDYFIWQVIYRITCSDCRQSPRLTPRIFVVQNL